MTNRMFLEKISVRHILMSILMIVCCSISLSAATTLTAQDVLTKTVNKINSAKGITCSFSLHANGRKISGTLKSSSNKFAITCAAYSSWYDGSKMWTYNPSTKETTLTIPSATEIAETNPLSYVRSYSNSFKHAFAKEKHSGLYVLTLTPIKRVQGIKSITLYVSTSNFTPSRIKITMSNGTSTDIALSSVNYSANLPASTFVYPAKKYPKVEIIDLR